MGRINVDLRGQVSLVTGAGKGIGREVALALARAGSQVALISRTSKDLNVVADEIKNMGSPAYVRRCDLTKVDDIKNMVDDVVAWGGKIDILVNSAGINIQADALDVTEEQWDQIMGTNLKGAFFCCQAVGKKMLPRQKGKMVNITSQMAFVGFYGRAAYCASKGGLTQLTKVLALEWAGHNINVNCVAPTFIKTPLTEPMLKDEIFYNEVIRRIPMGRIGVPGDVSDAVLFLVSDSANLMTGSTVLVDGGWVAL